MGLTGFYQLLKTHGCYEPAEIHLAELCGKTFAIDGDFVMYTALMGHTTGTRVSAVEISGHIKHWLNLAHQAGILTIFVTTGGPPPVEKQTHCSVVRQRKRARQQVVIDELTDTLSTLEDDLGQELYVREKIFRMQNSIRRITNEMSTSVVELLRTDGWTCIQAASEADFMLVQLAEDAKCDFVATDDADIIISGAEHVLRGFIHMLTRPSTTGRDFCRSNIMGCLQLTSDELMQLGSLLSCDYQPPIQNVGPVTAFRMIQAYGSVDTFLHSEAFNEKTKSKKRKYTLPMGMTPETYTTASSRSVAIFQSRPDRPPDVEARIL
jgi:5'-3' exonuclease